MQHLHAAPKYRGHPRVLVPETREMHTVYPPLISAYHTDTEYSELLVRV